MLNCSPPARQCLRALQGFILVLALVSGATATPRLDCEVSHAGKAVTLSFPAVADPYIVKPVNIDGRFRFKAVVVGDAQRIEYVKIYTYDLSTDYAVLLHEATYRSPHAALDTLTGQHAVYSLKRGRELTYQCALLEVKE